MRKKGISQIKDRGGGGGEENRKSKDLQPTQTILARSTLRSDTEDILEHKQPAASVLIRLR